jgi:hypothetical protein
MFGAIWHCYITPIAKVLGAISKDDSGTVQLAVRAENLA